MTTPHILLCISLFISVAMFVRAMLSLRNGRSTVDLVFAIVWFLMCLYTCKIIALNG
jgi:hypothetical protein